MSKNYNIKFVKVNKIHNIFIKSNCNKINKLAKDNYKINGILIIK